MSQFPKVFSLFPTPLYVNKYEGDLTSIVEYLDSQEMNTPSHGHGTLSKDSYILDNEICSPLTEWIKQCFREFATHIMRYDFEDIVLAQSWISYKEPGHFHKAHTHPNTLLAGVFYYDFEPDDASIVFSKEVKSFHRPYLEPSLLSDYQDHAYSQEEIYFTPERSTFIIFPSWLTHGVPPNRSSKVRKSLGVNALTKEKLGDRETISEILYKRYE